MQGRVQRTPLPGSLQCAHSHTGGKAALCFNRCGVRDLRKDGCSVCMQAWAGRVHLTKRGRRGGKEVRRAEAVAAGAPGRMWPQDAHAVRGGRGRHGAMAGTAHAPDRMAANAIWNWWLRLCWCRDSP